MKDVIIHDIRIIKMRIDDNEDPIDVYKRELSEPRYQGHPSYKAPPWAQIGRRYEVKE